ncbi:hypothetical protein O988_07947 [Pseudogymnoascus sp. VKM F-3808]|nr:hypothetical protein O988_07947 [Pseudogymnoascus sp. VKM F-3808]
MNSWMENVIEKEIPEMTVEYGDVPPPYFLYPGVHPFSICWRMGSGETHWMVFGAWWERQEAVWNEEQKIEYFRKYPPPPLWLAWTVRLLWLPEDEELSPDPLESDYSAYFAKAEALGLGTGEECKHAWRTFNEDALERVKRQEEKEEELKKREKEEKEVEEAKEE